MNWMTSLPAPEWVREDWRRDHGIDGLTDAEWDGDVAAIESEISVTESAVILPKDAAIIRGATALGWEVRPTRRNGVGCGDCGAARSAAGGARSAPGCALTPAAAQATAPGSCRGRARPRSSWRAAGPSASRPNAL